MPSQPLLTPPTQPIALHRSHLLAPAPDQLTSTPTTLRIKRENTLSGRDFTVHQFRRHEPPTSPRHSTLLYTVAGRYWSNSQHRTIRDASGQALLELKRVWWRRSWTITRAGGGELLSAEFKWGIQARITVRFENALVGGPWEEFRASRTPRTDEPPPYSAVVAEHNRDLGLGPGQSGAGLFPSGTETGTGTGTGTGEDGDGSDAESIAKTECTLPTYESVRRNSRHSLRDLLDAIEPPREPAPAPAQRPRSEGAGVSRVELAVEENGVVTLVTMGTRQIIHIRRENFMQYSVSGGPMPRWEVKVAEGVDLLLVCDVEMCAGDLEINRMTGDEHRAHAGGVYSA